MANADLFTKTAPYGQLTGLDRWPPYVAHAVESAGSFVGTCPCCDKRIVIKAQGVPLTPEEKEYIA